jgi:hypothetical protein
MSNTKRIMAAGAVMENGIFAAAPGVNVNEGHALIVDQYEQVLYDYLKREFPLGVKVNSVEASGPIHIWNEQKAIPSNTTAIDPKLGFGTTTPDYAKPSADLNTDYQRDNWLNAVPRTYATRIEYDYFTLRAEQRYGTFEDLTAKDYNDMFVDFNKVTTNDFWNGRSTGLNDTASTYKFEYTGILNQITDTAAIASGTTIADAVNTKIANLQARLDYSGMPNVLAMNSATYDILCKQEQKNANGIYLRNVTTEIIPGVEVPAIHTYNGTLPVILTPFIKPVTGTGKVTHKIVALNTSMIDRVWWFDNGPRVFEIANPNQPFANSRLLTNKMVLDFSTYILRGPQTGAHFVLTHDVATA